MILKEKPLENTVGKGDNAGNLHFLLFPQCFFIHPKENFCFSGTFILSSANVFNLYQPKNLLFGKELREKKYNKTSTAHTLLSYLQMT